MTSLFKKLALVLILCAPLLAGAQVTTHGGGTGLVDISSGSVPFGSVFNIRLATSSNFQFNNTASRLTVSYASTTALSATTLCLTGDICRTTWPTTASAASSTLLGDSNTFSGTLNTFSNAIKIGSFTGLVGANSGTTYATATGTETCSSGASCSSFTVVGTGGAITVSGLTTSNFSSANISQWTNNSNYITLASLSATTPILYNSTTGAFTWAGLATTTQPASSNVLTSNGTSGVYGTATSTLTATSPLTGSFTQLGSGGALGCQIASQAQAGCESAANFALFNNKLGTSSTLTVSQLLYVTGTGAAAAPTVAGVATSSPTFNGGLTTSGTAGAWVGGSGYTVSLAAINANSVLGNSSSASAAPTSLATSSLFTLSPGLTTVTGISSIVIPQSFTNFATTTGGWTGTSTLLLEITPMTETWNQIRCATDAGFLGVDVYWGTSHMNFVYASTTVGTTTLTTNNTVPMGQTVKVDIGTTTNNTNKSILCSIKKTI